MLDQPFASIPGLAEQSGQHIEAIGRGTIGQVTHSEANAAYGHPIVQLADGWILGGGEASGKTV